MITLLVAPGAAAGRRETVDEAEGHHLRVRRVSAGERVALRDGAGLVEVQIRLQKAFLALLWAGDQDLRDAARRHSILAMSRAEAGLDQEERQAVRTVASRVARER